MQGYARLHARLSSYFLKAFLTASREIGGRPFPFFGGKTAQEERVRLESARLEQQRLEREAAERKERIEALKTYVAGKVDLVVGRSASASNEWALAQADADKMEKLTASIMAENDKKGNELPYENRMLLLLKNDEINKLAIKYLASGFSVQTESFIAKVREARAAESRYREALSKVDAQRQKAMQDSSRWVGASKSQRDAEIGRLLKEIKSLEHQRATTRREMVVSPSKVREWTNKMRDYENEIARKRRQVDALRDPDLNRRIETKAASERQYVIDRANSEARNQALDVDRRLKPTTTVVKIAEETNKDTLERLRAKIKSQLEKLAAERNDLEKKLTVGREILLAVPVSDLKELNQLKLCADKELSLQ